MITARLTERAGRLRLVCIEDGRFVQCPTAWRESLAVGVVHTLAARERSDGACWVYYP